MVEQECISHNVVKHEFMKLGFKSKYAFYSICLEIDASLSFEVLRMYWELGVCCMEVYKKLLDVFEKLKHE